MTHSIPPSIDWGHSFFYPSTKASLASPGGVGLITLYQHKPDILTPARFDPSKAFGHTTLVSHNAMVASEMPGPGQGVTLWHINDYLTYCAGALKKGLYQGITLMRLNLNYSERNAVNRQVEQHLQAGAKWSLLPGGKTCSSYVRDVLDKATETSPHPIPPYKPWVDNTLRFTSPTDLLTLLAERIATNQFVQQGMLWLPRLAPGFEMPAILKKYPEFRGKVG
jgi:hypothetical protein